MIRHLLYLTAGSKQHGNNARRVQHADSNACAGTLIRLYNLDRSLVLFKQVTCTGLAEQSTFASNNTSTDSLACVRALRIILNGQPGECMHPCTTHMDMIGTLFT